MIHKRLLCELPWLELGSSDRNLSTLIDSLQAQKFAYYCIQGPHGSGKTRIMRETAKILENDPKIWVGCIDASVDDVFLVTTRALGDSITAANISPSEHLIELLTAIFATGKRIILLIDTAEKIEPELLACLFKLAKLDICLGADNRPLLTLVLFMGMAPINIATKKILSEAVSHTLTPMSVIQVKRLIDHVYAFMGMQHDFSSADIARLHGMSYGYPGRLFNLLALKDSQNGGRRKVYLFAALIVFFLGGTLWLGLSFFNRAPNPSVIIDEAAATNLTPHDAPFSTMVDNAPSNVELSASMDTLALTPSLLENTAEEATPTSDELHTVIGARIVTDQTLTSHMHTVSIPLEAQPPLVDQGNALDNGGAVLDEVIPLTAMPPPARTNTNTAQTEPTVPFYVIQLTRAASRDQALDRLKGRSVPGSPKTAKVSSSGKTQWITYIGPYISKEQASMGLKRLPSSLQRLAPKVLSSEEIR